MDGKIKIFHLFYRILSIEFFSSLFLCIPEKSNIYIQTKWEPTIKAHTRTQIILKWISCYFFFCCLLSLNVWVWRADWMAGAGITISVSFILFLISIHLTHYLYLARSVSFCHSVFFSRPSASVRLPVQFLLSVIGRQWII